MKRVVKVQDWKFKIELVGRVGGIDVKFDFIFIKNRFYRIPGLRFALDSVVLRSRCGNWTGCRFEKKKDYDRVTRMTHGMTERCFILCSMSFLIKLISGERCLP